MKGSGLRQSGQMSGRCNGAQGGFPTSENTADQSPLTPVERALVKALVSMLIAEIRGPVSHPVPGRILWG
jgi:hypothetical protein